MKDPFKPIQRSFPILRGALIVVAMLAIVQSHAQKKELLTSDTEITARAAGAMDALLLPGTRVHEAIMEEDLRGHYVLQISFREKGDISSVFVVSSSGGEIRSQNRFKDLVHQSQMPFKVPKGRHYRIEHTFDLDALHH